MCLTFLYYYMYRFYITLQEKFLIFSLQILEMHCIRLKTRSLNEIGELVRFSFARERFLCHERACPILF